MKTLFSTRMRRLCRLAAVALVASAGCDGDGKTETEEDAGVTDAASADAPDDEDGSVETDSDSGSTPQAPPVYAVATQVFGASGDENVTYVMLSDDLGRGELDPADAVVSVPGRALAFGANEGGQLFVGGDTPPTPGASAATLQRWDLQEDGTLEKFDAQVSFANLGVSSIGEYAGQFVFAGDDKAYYFDGSNAQVVIWNPKTMKLVDDESLDELILEGYLLSFSARAVVTEGKVYTFAGWRTMTSIPDQAAVVVVDSESDDVRVVTDDRCGYVRDGVLAEDGYIYMATENFASAVHRLNADNAAAPCLLRFNTETETFDADFHVELADLFDGATAGSLLAGPDGTAFIQVLNERVVFIDEATNPRVLASTPGAWQWASLTLGDEPEGEVLPVDPGGALLPVELGDEVYLPHFEGGFGDPYVSAMRHVTADGPGKLGASAPGLIFSALKLR